MSFSQEQKTVIISQPPKNPCCKHAFIHGVLVSRGDVVGDAVHISIDGDENVRFIREILHDLLSVDTQIIKTKVGGRRKTIELRARSAVKYLESVKSSSKLITLKCKGCQASFLKGIFFACGRISDPSKQFSLEFSLADRASMVADYFCSIGLEPRTSVKSSETVVYFRKSSLMEDFFAMSAMNSTVYELMYAKMNSESKGKAIRIANCETKNIERAILASSEICSLIEELIDKGLISLLPDELEYTARMRYENIDMSLARLAGIMTPSISKSGLSHRLDKIEEMARELLAKDKK